jgi:hypothetical protein
MKKFLGGTFIGDPQEVLHQLNIPGEYAVVDLIVPLAR